MAYDDWQTVTDLWAHEQEMAEARRNAWRLLGITTLLLANLAALANVLAMF